MPIASGITSADTLQILPAKDAFVSGTFHLTEYNASAEDIFLSEKDSSSVTCSVTCPSSLADVSGIGPGTCAADSWSDSYINTGLIAVCIILLVLYMRKFVTVLPYLVGGLFWWKKFAELENNMRLGRDRDALAFPAVVTLCICASRLDLMSPSFMDGLSAGMKTLAISGMFLAFLLVRFIIAEMMPRRRFGYGTLSASLGVSFDFEIILSSVLLTLIIPVSLSNSCLPAARLMALIIAAMLWLLSLVRKYQIIFPGCGQFQAILYLCAVEIISMAMLVASAVIL